MNCRIGCTPPADPEGRISLSTCLFYGVHSKGNGKAYRDKGYFGTFVPNGVHDMTMQRSTRSHQLPRTQKDRNARISKKRSPGERPFAVIKEVFHGGVTYLTTLARVHTKNVFAFFAYNLYQLVTLERKRLTKAL